MEDLQWANTTPNTFLPFFKATWNIYQHQAGWTHSERKERESGLGPELQANLHHLSVGLCRQHTGAWWTSPGSSLPQVA